MEDKLVHYLERFEEAAVNLGPQALELALDVVRIQSLSYIIVGIAFLALTIITAFVFARSAKIAHKESVKDIRIDRDIDKEADHGAMAFASLIAGAFFGLASAYFLLDVWNWIGAFAPHIRLARDVMERL